MKCDILETGQDENGSIAQAVVVQLVLHDDGTVTGTAEPGYETLLRRALEEPHFVDLGKRKVTVESDPKAWFASLPYQFDSAYMRAWLYEELEPTSRNQNGGA